MGKQRILVSIWQAMAALALCAPLPLLAQESIADAPRPTRPMKPPSLPDRLPEKPSHPPTAVFALEPLGFSPPGSIYLGQGFSLVSLDFLDDDQLLFTFRVPGLVHRDSGEGEERQMRALVLSVPTGKVESEALWTLHDRQRYLWMLTGGRFLFLRDRETLSLGDARLELKPFLRFPGPLLALDLDPDQNRLVTNSREPADTAHQPSDLPAPSDAEGQHKPQASAEIAVRILRRDSGQVLLVSRSRSTVRLPINAEGYLELLTRAERPLAAEAELLQRRQQYPGSDRIRLRAGL